GAGPLAAREIDGVVETPGVAEIIVAEDAMTAARDAVDAVKALRPVRGRIAGKDRVLNDERTAVERDVLHHRRGRPDAVVDQDEGVVGVDLGVVAADRCAGARVEST